MFSYFLTLHIPSLYSHLSKLVRFICAVLIKLSPTFQETKKMTEVPNPQNIQERVQKKYPMQSQLYKKWEGGVAIQS